MVMMNHHAKYRGYGYLVQRLLSRYTLQTDYSIVNIEVFCNKAFHTHELLLTSMFHTVKNTAYWHLHYNAPAFLLTDTKTI